MQKYTFVFLSVIFLSSLCPHLKAQKNLENWFKKCEGIAAVDMTVINSKNAETKKEDSKIVKVSFQQNPELLKELLSAYEKDKEKAYKKAEKREKGIIRPEYCRFGEGKIETRFLFDFKVADGATVTMQVFYDFKDEDRYPNG